MREGGINCCPPPPPPPLRPLSSSFLRPSPPAPHFASVPFFLRLSFPFAVRSSGAGLGSAPRRGMMDFDGGIGDQRCVSFNLLLLCLPPPSGFLIFPNHRTARRRGRRKSGVFLFFLFFVAGESRFISSSGLNPVLVD